MFDGLEEGDPPCFAQSRMLDVFGEIALQRVVTGHFVELAALLVEADPQPPLLVEDIADLQAAGGGDAGEGTVLDGDARGTKPKAALIALRPVENASLQTR